MRLRNRMVKATIWTDGDLLRWPRDKREFYRSLWACAEDSCCIEDDMFAVKVAAWPSPLDADMSVERFEVWRDELIEAGKLVPYEVDGRRYFYIPAMQRHERAPNPQSPDNPLPPWVEWVPSKSDKRKGSYEHHHLPAHILPNGSPTVAQALGNDSPTLPVLYCTGLDCTEQDCAVLGATDPPKPAPLPDSPRHKDGLHQPFAEAFNAMQELGGKPATTTTLPECMAVPEQWRPPKDIPIGVQDSYAHAVWSLVAFVWPETFGKVPPDKRAMDDIKAAFADGCIPGCDGNREQCDACFACFGRAVTDKRNVGKTWGQCRSLVKHRMKPADRGGDRPCLAPST